MLWVPLQSLCKYIMGRIVNIVVCVVVVVFVVGCILLRMKLTCTSGHWLTNRATKGQRVGKEQDPSA